MKYIHFFYVVILVLLLSYSAVHFFTGSYILAWRAMYSSVVVVIIMGITKVNSDI